MKNRVVDDERDTRGEPSAAPVTRGRRRRAGPAVIGVLAACLIVLVAVVVPRVHDLSLPGPARSEPTPAALPDQVVGGYWMKWDESDSVPLAEVDPGYNVIYLAFAQGREGTGALHFDQSAQPAAQFARDVETVRARDQRLILSIGGEGGHVDISTPQRRQEMIDSLIRIHREEVPFDGIDWDVEMETFDVDAALAVSLALKEHYGPDLGITMAPPGGDRIEYKQLAQRLGENLSYIGVQYYDYPTPTQQDRLDGVHHRTRELIDVYGIPADKIVIGMMVVDEQTRQYAPPGTTHYWTLESSLQGWKDLEGSFPGLRGVYLWEVSGDARLGGAWVSTVAPQVTRSPAATPGG